MFAQKFLIPFTDLLLFDIGTSNIRLGYKNSKKGVIEPACLALNKETNIPLAFGEEAKEMSGRTSKNMVIVNPIRNGVIDDYEATENLVNNIIKKNSRLTGWKKLTSLLIGKSAIVLIPLKISEVQISALVDALNYSGIKNIFIVESSIAVLFGIEKKFFKNKSKTLLDLGRGKFSISTISSGRILYSRNFDMSGQQIDSAIISYIKNKYNLEISMTAGESLKINNLDFNLSKSKSKDVKKISLPGRDIGTGIPRNIELDYVELAEAVEPVVKKLIINIKSYLEQVSSEIVEDILQEGIHLFGGESLINGLDAHMQKALDIKILRCSDPLCDGIEGMKFLAENMDVLEKIQIRNFLFR